MKTVLTSIHPKWVEKTGGAMDRIEHNKRRKRRELILSILVSVLGYGAMFAGVVALYVLYGNF